MTWPSATLPDRDEPGDETDGDRGGERRPLRDVNRLCGAIVFDCAPSGEPSSMGEKHRWGEWIDEQPDSEPPSSPASRLPRRLRRGLLCGLFRGLFCALLCESLRLFGALLLLLPFLRLVRGPFCWGLLRSFALASPSFLLSSSLPAAALSLASSPS